MNIKIIILIVLIIILIIIGCWYIINLYNNKEKSKNDDESNTSFGKTHGGEITYYKDEYNKTIAIIPISSDMDKNTFSMPKELFINIVKFLNAFDENYNKILKSDDEQNKINELWILKYKLNIYNSKLEYYKNKKEQEQTQKQKQKLTNIDDNTNLYFEILDKYTIKYNINYNRNKYNTLDDLQNFKDHIKTTEKYKHKKINSGIFNKLKEICKLQSSKEIETRISDVIKICNEENDDDDMKKTIITIIIKNFIYNIINYPINSDLLKQMSIYGSFLFKLTKSKIFDNLEQFIYITIASYCPLFYLLCPQNDISYKDYKIFMRYEKTEKDKQYEKRIILIFYLLLLSNFDFKRIFISDDYDSDYDFKSISDSDFKKFSDSDFKNIYDLYNYISLLICIDRNSNNRIGKKQNLPLGFYWMFNKLYLNIIKNHNQSLYKQSIAELKEYINYYSKANKKIYDNDKPTLNRLQKLLKENEIKGETTQLQFKKENISEKEIIDIGRRRGITDTRKGKGRRREKKTTEITEEMKNELGDKLFDFINNMHNYSENDTVKIVNNMINSFEYNALKNMVETNKNRLTDIIKTVYDETIKK